MNCSLKWIVGEFLGWVCEHIFFVSYLGTNIYIFLSEMRTQNTCRLNNILKEISFSQCSFCLIKPIWQGQMGLLPIQNTYTIWFFFLLGCCLLEIFWHLLVQWFNFMAIFFLWYTKRSRHFDFQKKRGKCCKPGYNLYFFFQPSFDTKGCI